MKIGIIAEFNPLHSGHIHLINSTKRKFPDASIYIIMSSYLMQRGDFSFIDPYQKVKLALQFGADFVFELPPFVSSQRADIFARGAVSICKQLELDALAFGVEDISFFTHEDKAVKTTEDTEQRFLQRIHKFNNMLAPNPHWQPTANNILAHFYTEAAAELYPHLLMLPIQRIGSDYNDTELNNEIASATAIRLAAIENNLESLKCFLPYNPALLKNHITWTMLYPHFQHTVITHPHLETFATVGQSGLATRIKKEIYHTNFEDFINAVKTRAYTRTAIQRAMLFIFLNITQAELDSFTTYSFTLTPRLLGANKKKTHLLKKTPHFINIQAIDNDDYRETIEKIEKLYSLYLAKPKHQHFPFIFDESMA